MDASLKSLIVRRTVIALGAWTTLVAIAVALPYLFAVFATDGALNADAINGRATGPSKKNQGKP